MAEGDLVLDSLCPLSGRLVQYLVRLIYVCSFGLETGPSGIFQFKLHVRSYKVDKGNGLVVLGDGDSLQVYPKKENLYEHE